MMIFGNFSTGILLTLLAALSGFWAVRRASANE